VETDLKKFELQTVLHRNNPMKVAQFLCWHRRKSKVAQASECLFEG
jgi:hypothetical protein